jgi:hypothetical protein
VLLLRSVIWMCSPADRLLLLDDGVTFTRTEGLRDSDWLDLPPSKYSISSDVWLLLFDRPCSAPPLRFFVRTVTGLPSEGSE